MYYQSAASVVGGGSSCCCWQRQERGTFRLAVLARYVAIPKEALSPLDRLFLGEQRETKRDTCEFTLNSN